MKYLKHFFLIVSIIFIIAVTIIEYPIVLSSEFDINICKGDEDIVIIFPHNIKTSNV